MQRISSREHRRVRAALVAIGLLLSGCRGELSGADEDRTRAGSQVEARHAQHGRVGFDLELAPGVEVFDVSFLLTNPNGYERSGTLPIDDRGAYSALFLLPAAPRYQLDLVATTTSGHVCEGAAEFDVILGMRTAVRIPMRCPEFERAGSLGITGSLNTCPRIESLVASSLWTEIGQSITLSVTASDFDAQPQPLSYEWTATAGSFTDGTTAVPTWTCTEVGTSDVTIVVFDGDLGCPEASSSFVLTCVEASEPVPVVPIDPTPPPPPPPPPPPDEDAGVL